MKLPGVLPARPEDAGEEVAAILKDHRERNRMHLQRKCYPGRAECVLWDDRLLFCDILGMADAEHKIPMTERTLFRGFSMTKSVTAIGACVLADEGKLCWRDPVAKYIPSFGRMKVVKKAFAAEKRVTFEDSEKLEALKRPITLADLALHTSGLGYGPQRPASEWNLRSTSVIEHSYKTLGMRCESGEVKSMREFCDELAKIPVRSQPGKKYVYSYGMDVIGHVLEIISGQPLDVFLRERVGKPLGFQDVTFALPRASATQIAAYYCLHRPPVRSGLPQNTRELRRYDGKRPEQSAWVKGSSTQRGVLPVGGGFWGTCKGGLLFSLRDVARMVGMLLNEGRTAWGQQLLRPSTIKSLQTDWLAKSWISGRCKRRNLDGFDSLDLGWSPIGHVQLTGPHKGALFMGGTGYWWADPRRKLAMVTLYESYWMVPASDWKADRDDLEAVIEKFVKSTPKPRWKTSLTARRSSSRAAAPAASSRKRRASSSVSDPKARKNKRARIKK